MEEKGSYQYYAADNENSDCDKSDKNSKSKIHEQNDQNSNSQQNEKKEKSKSPEVELQKVKVKKDFRPPNQFNYSSLIQRHTSRDEVEKIDYDLILNQEVTFKIDTDPISHSENQVFTSRIYKVLNEEKQFQTARDNLIQKVKNIEDTFQRNIKTNMDKEEQLKLEKMIQNESDDQDDNKIKQLELLKKPVEQDQKINLKGENFDTSLRYFNQQTGININCRRCGENGHYERMCSQEVKYLCIHCLGNHNYRQCTIKTCFKCNQEGHMGRDCKETGRNCYRCQKKGHQKHECGVIKLYDRQKDREDDFYRFKKDLKRIKCFNCNEKGHFTCGHIQQKDHDKIYKRSLIEQVERDKRRQLKEKQGKKSGKQGLDKANNSDDDNDDYDDNNQKQSKKSKKQQRKEEKIYIKNMEQFQSQDQKVRIQKEIDDELERENNFYFEQLQKSQQFKKEERKSKNGDKKSKSKSNNNNEQFEGDNEDIPRKNKKNKKRQFEQNLEEFEQKQEKINQQKQQKDLQQKKKLKKLQKEDEIEIVTGDLGVVPENLKILKDEKIKQQLKEDAQLFKQLKQEQEKRNKSQNKNTDNIQNEEQEGFEDKIVLNKNINYNQYYPQTKLGVYNPLQNYMIEEKEENKKKNKEKPKKLKQKSQNLAENQEESQQAQNNGNYRNLHQMKKLEGKKGIKNSGIDFKYSTIGNDANVNNTNINHRFINNSIKNNSNFSNSKSGKKEEYFDVVEKWENADIVDVGDFRDYGADNYKNGKNKDKKNKDHHNHHSHHNHNHNEFEYDEQDFGFKVDNNHHSHHNHNNNHKNIHHHKNQHKSKGLIDPNQFSAQKKVHQQYNNSNKNNQKHKNLKSKNKQNDRNGSQNGHVSNWENFQQGNQYQQQVSRDRSRSARGKRGARRK